jgi:hypothetical protein
MLRSHAVMTSIPRSISFEDLKRQWPQRFIEIKRRETLGIRGTWSASLSGQNHGLEITFARHVRDSNKAI